VFAVGLNGCILHYDGTTWTAMVSNTSQGFWNIWVVDHVIVTARQTMYLLWATRVFVIMMAMHGLQCSAIMEFSVAYGVPRPWIVLEKQMIFTRLVLIIKLYTTMAVPGH